MFERKLFASFYTLQHDRYRSSPFKIGTSVSVIAHLLFFVFAYSVGIKPDVAREHPMEVAEQGGVPAGEVVEVANGPLIMPKPEVIRQLLGEAPSAEPRHPSFIAEQSSIARGEANPDPRGSSPLPKSSGAGKEIASTGSNPGKSQSLTDRTGPSTPRREETPQERSDRKVVESTNRLPTVTPKPPTQLPDAGGGPDLAKLGGATREPPSTINNQDSAIVIRGPISVNAKGVGAVEEYRAYLERAIQRRWQIPAEAALLSQPVSLTVEFTVAQDGRLLSVRLHSSTGIRALDRAALQAIEQAAPFRPLPGIFAGPTQVFTDTFVYYPPSS
ncbi:MAG: TonB family protein [Acidobacteria bacterium]|nr:TonB family protein [Acidobacteriota bacterium]